MYQVVVWLSLACLKASLKAWIFHVVYCFVLCTEQEKSMFVDIGRNILFVTGDNGRYTPANISAAVL